MKQGIHFLQRHALYFAWLIALIGFGLSVFYGEIQHHEPCSLCWYQRIALFPLVILLGIAAYRGESMIIPYVLPLVIIGGLVAFFHVLQGHFPILQKAGVCHLGPHCSKSYFSLFGLFDFPSVSAIGFFLIAFLLLLHAKKES